LNDPVQRQRDQALRLLDSRIVELSTLYRHCYQVQGRGSLLVYASDIVERRRTPNEMDFRTKKQMLDIFDAPSSRAEITEMIDTYNPETEGIMALITDYNNATFFVTFRLK
jgi:hypothetical protein